MKFVFVGVESEKNKTKPNCLEEEEGEGGERAAVVGVLRSLGHVSTCLFDLPRTGGSSDSLFTPFEVAGVSRMEALQNCRMLIPR